MTAKIAAFLLRHLAALGCIAVIKLALTPFETLLGIQIIALLYLLPVMLSTVLWGLTPGVLAAFAAFLTFNYFHIQPYHTLAVHQNQDIITLVIFLIVAVVMSQLIGQARRGVELARLREWEATRMYQLISALLGLQDVQSVAVVLAQHTRETFGFARVEVRTGGVTQAAGVEPPGPPGERLPLQTVRVTEGELCLWRGEAQQSSEEQRLLQAFCSQGALALERVRLARAENKARVLEESDQMKSSLLNSVSHELRSPLAAIKASVSSLRSGAVAWDTDARAELLETVEEETDTLNALVGNLLDMSRIETGSLAPQQRWNSIAEIAATAARRMRKQTASHRLELDFPPGLPLVSTDYLMMEQVFTNLIGNSIKYAPPGSAITLSARAGEGGLRVQVANQGPPVAQEHLERIFDKFYRANASDRITGSGLGLSICKGIVEAHGGQIWAENQPGRMVFHFTLPQTLDQALAALPREPADGSS